MLSQTIFKPVRAEQSALFKAVSNNRPRTIERLLREHPDLLNAYHPRLGVTPLWSAFSKRHRDNAITALVQHGADVSLVSRKSRDTLLSMALQNYPVWVPFLLEKGICPLDRGQAYQSNYGLRVEWSDLDLACQKCPQHVRALLDHGATPNQKPIVFTSSPLAHLLKSMVDYRKDASEPVLALIQAGADPNHCVGPHQPAWFRWWELMTRPDGQRADFQNAHGLMLERVRSPLMRWSDGSFLHAVATGAAKAKWDGQQLLDFLKPVHQWLGQEAFEKALLLEVSPLTPEQDRHQGWRFSGVVALSFCNVLEKSGIERAISRAQAWVTLGADPNEANCHGTTAAHVIAAALGRELAEPGMVKQFSQLKFNWLAQDSRGATPESLALGDESTYEERVSWKNQVLETILPSAPFHKVVPRL